MTLTLASFTAPLAAVAPAASDVHSHRVGGAATIPFILLLAGIAFWPLLHRRSWERYYVHLALGLGFAVFAYYSLVLDPHRMLHSLREYASFIALIGCLFVTAGGI